MHHLRPIRTALVALCVTVAVALTATASAQPPSASGPQPALERELVREMNLARRAHGVRPLRTVPTLARPARAHSAFMARTGAFQHEAANGAPFWIRLVRAGYPRNRGMSENIALLHGCGRDTAREVVRLWMESPGHRANLLDPDMRSTGAGVVATADCDEVLFTADYGG